MTNNGQTHTLQQVKHHEKTNVVTETLLIKSEYETMAETADSELHLI
jgi:hypothetical protein